MAALRPFRMNCTTCGDAEHAKHDEQAQLSDKLDKLVAEMRSLSDGVHELLKRVTRTDTVTLAMIADKNAALKQVHRKIAEVLKARKSIEKVRRKSADVTQVLRTLS